jgi:hypothetical protein
MQHEDRDAQTPDGLYRVYSPKLIAFLISNGCEPRVCHRDGQASFHRTGTFRNLVDEYMRSRNSGRGNDRGTAARGGKQS